MFKEIESMYGVDKKHYVYELYTCAYFANPFNISEYDKNKVTSIMVETDKRAGSKAFKKMAKELSEKYGVFFDTYKNAKNTYAEYKEVWYSYDEYKAF